MDKVAPFNLTHQFGDKFDPSSNLATSLAFNLILHLSDLQI